jgi:hypothetical protein
LHARRYFGQILNVVHDCVYPGGVHVKSPVQPFVEPNADSNASSPAVGV